MEKQSKLIYFIFLVINTDKGIKPSEYHVLSCADIEEFWRESLEIIDEKHFILFF